MTPYDVKTTEDVSTRLDYFALTTSVAGWHDNLEAPEIGLDAWDQARKLCKTALHIRPDILPVVTPDEDGYIHICWRHEGGMVNYEFRGTDSLITDRPKDTKGSSCYKFTTMGQLLGKIIDL